MTDQVQIRKQLSKTDFAYTGWYQLPKRHTLHVVWQDDIHVTVILTKVYIKGFESVVSNACGIYRYDSIDLENHIKFLNRFIRKLLTS